MSWYSPAAPWFALLLWAVTLVQANGHGLVPICIAENCSAEAKALGGDAYSQALAGCISENFGPCVHNAWDCLGDDTCRSVVNCIPPVVKSCGPDIWAMMTSKKERDRIACLTKCTDKGKVDYWCAVKCGAEAVKCLADSVCRHAAECVPKALYQCSAAGFRCIFSSSDVCRRNVKCLADGIGTCADPATNALTDTRIADLVTCAGRKCPRPERTVSATAVAARSSGTSMLPAAGPAPGASPAIAEDGNKAVADADVTAPAQLGAAVQTVAALFDAAKVPANTTLGSASAAQLLCIAEKCGSKVLKVLHDRETKKLLRCASDAKVTHLCSSVWQCLGRPSCAKAIQCWSEPLAQCGADAWHVLTSQKDRWRLSTTYKCLRQCKADNTGEFMSGSFCLLDKCAEGMLECKAHPKCWGAAQCLSRPASKCLMRTLDTYVHERLFSNSAKCIGRGMEACGRRAVAMLQNPNIARAVHCAARCTHKPGKPSTGEALVMV